MRIPVLRRCAGALTTLHHWNRCFPSKAIRAWLAADDRQRCTIVATYFAAVGRFGPTTVQLRNPATPGDPLYAVWASTHVTDIEVRPATAGDQRVVSRLLYDAFFVPPGTAPFARSIVDAPTFRPYHEEFGSRGGDVGRVAVDRCGEPVGAAWVRQIRGHGFVDDRTPELSIAVVEDRRGAGVGSALLASLLDAVPRVSLSTDRRNPALRLYERFGFEVVRNEGDHTLVMVRDGEET